MLMTWSERFAAHLTRKGLSQQEAAFSLHAFGVRATQSQIHYWCRGSVPREATRTKIAAWSGGEIPTETGDESTGDLSDDDSATLPAVTGT